MRKLLILFLSVFFINGYTQETTDTITLKEVSVSAFSPYQANYLTPITFKNLTNVDIGLKNYGQEPSQILNTTPNITSTSDAGSPWGYTYIRLRGIDQTRINMTLNGVPMNEPEDQGCYFNNYPDFLSSLDMVQIERGSGMTKNGVSSFGGSFGFDSHLPIKNDVSLNIGAGSFGALKLGFQINQKWRKGGFYVQMSDVQNDGYKYHSGNRSQSLFFNSYYDIGKNTFKLIGFAGRQRNELAWLGVSQDSINKDRRINGATKKENDDFEQYHIQFHHIYHININSKFNYCVYYNYLKGFYTFDNNNFLEIPTPGPIYQYNLYSNFVGAYINFSQKINRWDFYVGTHGYIYNRKHVGSSDSTGYLYTNTGYRNEASVFFKTNYNVWKGLNLYGDIQYRYTDFKYDGDVYLKPFYWNFVNYNVGVDYHIGKFVIYYSYGKTSREPTRNDIFYGFDNLQCDSAGNAIYNDLKPETSYDNELGFRVLEKKLTFNFNLFYMSFKNEITLNGQFGPTGLPLHENVDKSYREGVETDFQYRFDFGLNLNLNATYNHSIIKQGDLNINPVLTPKAVANCEAYYKYKWFNIGVDFRYQDWSYVDFSNKYLIPDFYTINGRIGVNWKWFDFTVYGNNLLNQKYLTSGQMNYDGSQPLYFVGMPINFYATLKITIDYNKNHKS